MTLSWLNLMNISLFYILCCPLRDHFMAFEKPTQAIIIMNNNMDVFLSTYTFGYLSIKPAILMMTFFRCYHLMFLGISSIFNISTRLDCQLKAPTLPESGSNVSPTEKKKNNFDRLTAKTFVNWAEHHLIGHRNSCSYFWAVIIVVRIIWILILKTVLKMKKKAPIRRFHRANGKS